MMMMTMVIMIDILAPQNEELLAAADAALALVASDLTMVPHTLWLALHLNWQEQCDNAMIVRQGKEPEKRN